MEVEVDSIFFQDPEHRPNSTIPEADGIPLIDLSPLSTVFDPDGASKAALDGLLEEVESACRGWGFFQVVNHGVPVELLKRVQAAAREFFALPTEEKRRVSRGAANPLGYYDTEHTKNVRDWKEVFDFMVEEDPASCEEEGRRETRFMKNQWPEYPPNLREACEEYVRGVEKLAFRLLELISLTLGLPARRLNGFFTEGQQSSCVRLNHYPPCPSPHLALGVGRHKDSGALTVLAQDDVGGLDFRRKNDEWVRVKPIPNSFIINVGDIVQVWSNERYESTEHRALVNSKRERFFVVFSFHPCLWVTVKPLDEMVSEQDPPRYQEYNWGDFFRMRGNNNFEKLSEENLQIYHYKKTTT